jgi:23S rRNA (pseudouridine1915-N3)-methyltransferase
LRIGIDYYLKVLKKHHNVMIQEISEAKIPLRASKAEIRKAVVLESDSILKRINPMEKVILMDVQGMMLSSVEFKSKLVSLSDGGQMDLCLIIGGSHGVSREMFMGKAYFLSFSRMTFPHQLMRLVLLEQLSRILS